MITVRSNNDLRDAYFLIHALQGIQQTADVKAIIRQQKWAIRHFNRRAPQPTRTIKADLDSLVLLEKLPISPDSTMEEAIALFEGSYFVPTPRSQYDCTGQCFTTYYKVFRRHNAWYAYHFMSRDV